MRVVSVGELGQPISNPLDSCQLDTLASEDALTLPSPLVMRASAREWVHAKNAAGAEAEKAAEE